LTRVPPPGASVTSHVPPNSAARSRCDSNPTPAGTSGPMPMPLSRTSTRRATGATAGAGPSGPGPQRAAPCSRSPSHAAQRS
jgi:hypothetical protein